VLRPLRSASRAQWVRPAADEVGRDPVDTDLCRAAAAIVHIVCDDRSAVMTEDGCKRLTPADVAVVVARRTQVDAVRARLPRALRDVTVGTANRVQGLEWPLVLALDPCSNAVGLNNFLLEAGRMCVQLSRHSVAGLWLTRADVLDRLERHVPMSTRSLGAFDSEYHGLASQLAVRQGLVRVERMH
jgi:hypothetical protein